MTKSLTGQDVKETQSSPQNSLIRSIFATLVTLRSTLVVHNGFLDLMFLYNSFYAPLPLKLEQFVADTSDMFTIIDTKYVAEFLDREGSTFLAYLYRK